MTYFTPVDAHIIPDTDTALVESAPASGPTVGSLSFAVQVGPATEATA